MITHEYINENELKVTSTCPELNYNHAIVATEEELEKALEDCLFIVMRGMIPCKKPKKVKNDGTRMRSEDGKGGLIFTMEELPYPNNPRGITIEANDCTFEDFHLISTTPLSKDAYQYGLVFSEQTPVKSHRTTIRRMTINNWRRCMSKDGGVGTPLTEDVRIEDTLCLDYMESGAYLNFGFDRLVVERSLFAGSKTSDPTVIGAGIKGGANWRDCTIRDCVSIDSNGMGYEFTRSNASEGSPEIHDRTKIIGCLAMNTKSFGFSIGFCRGAIYAHCTAKNVGMCGFELCGRAPEFVVHDPTTPKAGSYGQGIIDNCIVDGVNGYINPDGSDSGAGAVGMSIDAVEDSTVIGGQILNVVSGHLEKDFGISLYTSERCHINGVSMKNYGVYGVKATHGYGPYDRGFHVIENNVFRNKPGDTEREGVYIEWTGASVRNNTCWAAPGTIMHHIASVQNPTAKVYVDGVLFATNGYMLGSNLILPA